MKKAITKYSLALLTAIILFPSLLFAQVEISLQIEPPNEKAAPNQTQSTTVDRNYIIFDNLDYYVDTCYIAPLRDTEGIYYEDYEARPFSAATFNSVDITDYNVAIFPVGNSGWGMRTVPPFYGSRYSLSTGDGNIKIIDKIMEMLNAGRHVIVIAQNALWGNQNTNDPDVNNFLNNIMGIDYKGQYKCGTKTQSGSSTEWKWWMFKIEGTIGDPVGMGAPRYYNGGDESSGNAIQPLSYFLGVDWFETIDPEKFVITDRATTAQSDTAFGIRAKYYAGPDKDTARIVFWSAGFEGYGGRWRLQRNMMWQAMRWVLDESSKPAPEIEVTPNTLNFGGVPLGEEKVLEMTARHVGIETLEITEIFLDLYFATPDYSEAFQIVEGGIDPASDPPVSLQPGEEHKIKVKFAPDMGEVNYTVELIIYSNADLTQQQEIWIEGKGGEEVPEGGFFALDVQQLDFDKLAEGIKSERDFTITNEGTVSILISVYIDDETNDSLSFNFPEVINNPKYIDPGESLTYTVRFFPLTENTVFHGKVRITASNATNGNLFFLDLVGESDVWESVPGEASTPDGLLTVKASPNPFSGRTKIEYTISGEAPRRVEMNIVDMSGRKVASFFNGTLSPGSYSADLEASNIASGTYYLAAKIGASSLTLPLVIEK